MRQAWGHSPNWVANLPSLGEVTFSSRPSGWCWPHLGVYEELVIVPFGSFGLGLQQTAKSLLGHNLVWGVKSTAPPCLTNKTLEVSLALSIASLLHCCKKIIIIMTSYEQFLLVDFFHSFQPKIVLLVNSRICSRQKPVNDNLLSV